MCPGSSDTRASTSSRNGSSTNAQSHAPPPSRGKSPMTRPSRSRELTFASITWSPPVPREPTNPHLSIASRPTPLAAFTLIKFRPARANVWVHKKDYCRPGLGQPIKIPASDVALTMVRSGRILVTVDFAGRQRPEAYIVEIAPEGGNVVGSWGGSANIDAGNQFIFRDVPPGRYVIKGHPNPSSADQASNPVTIELKGGQASRITLKAR